MIIGNGSLASKLKDRTGTIFFASGVSDSSITSIHDEGFDREKKLIQSFAGTRLSFFYFSTISISLKKSAYTFHKQNMEDLVSGIFVNHNIIRIGNLENDSNPNTFLNVLRKRIDNKEPVNIRDEWKYMITDEDLVSITQSLPLTGGRLINVFSYMKKVKDLIKDL